MLVPVYLKLRAGADNSLPRFFFFFFFFFFFKIAAVRARKESILPATPASLKLASNQRFRGQFLRSENQVHMHSHFAARTGLEVKPLTLLYSTFDRKGTPFV